MQKDEIWELKPEEKNAAASPADEPGKSGDAQAPEPKKKEPDRLDMDEILDLKPQEEARPDEPKPDVPKPEPGGLKQEKLELVDMDEKKSEESVVPQRKEETAVSMEKPQVLEPDEEKKPSGKPEELQGGAVKKYERAPTHTRVKGAFGQAKESRFLTVGLLIVFIFLAGSAALIALPFFGITSIPDEMPVVGQILEFYRNLPIFPD
jgi:hypothetical protein